jgi:trimethylguanosine synthase
VDGSNVDHSNPDGGSGASNIGKKGSGVGKPSVQASWEQFFREQYSDYFVYYWQSVENSTHRTTYLESYAKMPEYYQALGFSGRPEPTMAAEGAFRVSGVHLDLAELSEDASKEMVLPEYNTATSDAQSSVGGGIIISSADAADGDGKRVEHDASEPDAPDESEQAVPKRIQKYWAQRYRFFSKFDQGIRLDEESWFSVTPECLAIHVAKRCSVCDVVVDAFCGSGGNTIQLAMRCKQVIAIDIDPAKIEMARHNAAIYGVADKISFRVANFFEVAESLNADAVFLSPPWGGPEYLDVAVYDLTTMEPSIGQLRDACHKIADNTVYFLPRNTDVTQLIELAGPGGHVEVEQQVLNRKLKAIAAYFGPDISTQ